jgi:hypothetical protein
VSIQHLTDPPKPPLSEDQFQRIKKQLLDSYQGDVNAGNIFLFEGGQDDCNIRIEELDAYGISVYCGDCQLEERSLSQKEYNPKDIKHEYYSISNSHYNR